jgi:hypothetical protein
MPSSRQAHFCMGKFQTQNLVRPGVLKICQTSLPTTFVLRVLEILRSPASVSKFEKMAKKHDFFQFSQKKFKDTAQTFNVFSFFESFFIVGITYDTL